MNAVNILLVDDQPAKLLSYEVVLQDLGENLLKAQSGREALEYLLRNDVAVILVDVCMPEQDGFELVRTIREHPRYQSTAIIFVSAVMMAEPDRLRGYAAAAKLRKLNEELEQRIDQRTQEREEALAQLFEAQKLDSIGHLTGGVAHDFNNLLMVILGSLHLLKKRLPADERNDRLVNNAVQAAERGSALTQRLLAFARRQDLKPQPVDFQKLFESMEDLLCKAVGPGIEIRSQIPADLPRILVDNNQLELALLNLFVNARDAMDNGGNITVDAVCTANPLPSGLTGGNYVRISVSDDGDGMDALTVSRATEPFFTTKGLGKGTGLGLSMIQGLTAPSGGVLEISSVLKAGTTVTLWLPVAEEHHSRGVPVLEGSSAKSSHAALAALSVLVVDDDPLVSMGTAAMLDDLGHTATEVSSASQALELLSANNRFDLVVTDHAMPGMTGAGLGRLITVSFPGLPVILASGYAELPEEQRNPKLPRLTKPFTQDELEKALFQAIAAKPPPYR
ncbi:response regulator [Rhizobium sp. RAF56]|uniref:response regulator n=1 Tax=Rhizobium sp. RAF56 TaxID=3233062 RepID=UPI003F95F180